MLWIFQFRRLPSQSNWSWCNWFAFCSSNSALSLSEFHLLIWKSFYLNLYFNIHFSKIPKYIEKMTTECISFRRMRSLTSMQNVYFKINEYHFKIWQITLIQKAPEPKSEQSFRLIHRNIRNQLLTDFTQTFSTFKDVSEHTWK